MNLEEWNHVGTVQQRSVKKLKIENEEKSPYGGKFNGLGKSLQKFLFRSKSLMFSNVLALWVRSNPILYYK